MNILVYYFYNWNYSCPELCDPFLQFTVILLRGDVKSLGI